jgi:hypothetical protein
MIYGVRTVMTNDRHFRYAIAGACAPILYFREIRPEFSRAVRFGTYPDWIHGGAFVHRKDF